MWCKFPGSLLMAEKSTVSPLLASYLLQMFAMTTGRLAKKLS